MNIFGLAMPQIQAELHIPENQVGLTVAYFRIAAIFAMLLAASADLVGRRRLLLVHPVRPGGISPCSPPSCRPIATFVGAQFLTRVFGYAEEMLCFVVIAEEVAANARGWANGTLTAMYYFGARPGVAGVRRGQSPALWLARHLCDRRAAAVRWSPICAARLPETNASPRKKDWDQKLPKRCGWSRTSRGNIRAAWPSDRGGGLGLRFRHLARHRAGAEISAGRLSLFARAR